jgi:hypothetical protein
MAGSLRSSVKMLPKCQILEASFSHCFSAMSECAERENCFDEHADGAESLVRCLAKCSQLEDLDFRGCIKIPGAAWAAWRDSEMPKLKKASFEHCFEENGDGAESLLRCLAKSSDLRDLRFSVRYSNRISYKLGSKIPGAAWQVGKAWPWPLITDTTGIPDAVLARARLPKALVGQC